MSRRGKSRSSTRPDVAYFVRRCQDGCTVIELYPDDREEVVASGLDLTDAENLCVRKIDEMLSAALPPPDDPGPSRIVGRRNARQLMFKF